MTVGNLIRELERYDEDMEVLIKGSNSMYVDSIRHTNEEEVRAFYGEDFNALIICGGNQVGAV